MSIYHKEWLSKFLNPKNQPDEIKEYLERENDFLLKNVIRGSSLVDFGCGFGRHLELLSRRLSYRIYI